MCRARSIVPGQRCRPCPSCPACWGGLVIKKKRRKKERTTDLMWQNWNLLFKVTEPTHFFIATSKIKLILQLLRGGFSFAIDSYSEILSKDFPLHFLFAFWRTGYLHLDLGYQERRQLYKLHITYHFFFHEVSYYFGSNCKWSLHCKDIRCQILDI